MAQFHQAPVAALESADRVLPALKEPEMFATLALLHFDGPGQAEYALAGHVPIVHYRERSRDTVQLSMHQLPLGSSSTVLMQPGTSYILQAICS